MTHFGGGRGIVDILFHRKSQKETTRKRGRLNTSREKLIVVDCCWELEKRCLFGENPRSSCWIPHPPPCLLPHCIDQLPRSSYYINIATMKFSISSLVILSLAGVSNAFVSREAAYAPMTALNVATETRDLKVPVLDEVCETTGVTLKRYMNEVAMLNPELTELVTLFGAIDTACKAITNMVKRSQLPSSETLGLEGEVNVQGEDQKKLDVITNEVLKRALRFTGRMGVLASEEEDVPVSRRFVEWLFSVLRTSWVLPIRSQ